MRKRGVFYFKKTLFSSKNLKKLRVLPNASHAVGVLCGLCFSMEICSMNEKIHLKDMLSDMKKLDSQKNPVPFSLSVRTFNRQNHSGGKLIVYHNVTLLQQAKNKNACGGSPPRHWENRTRNIKLPNGQIKKISILFIIAYNGKNVVF